VGSLCHPCIAGIHLSDIVLSLKLPPPPCPALLVIYALRPLRKLRFTAQEGYSLELGEEFILGLLGADQMTGPYPPDVVPRVDLSSLSSMFAARARAGKL